MAPETWKTSSPAADVVSIRSSTLVNAAGLEAFDGFEQFFEGAAEAIETGNAEAVAGPGMVDQFRQGRTLEPSARDHVDEHANGAGLPQPILLAGGILCRSRDPGITEDVTVAGRAGRLNIVRFRDGFHVHTLSSVQGIRDRLFTRLFILNGLGTGTIVLGRPGPHPRPFHDAQQKRVIALNLVIAAIVYWNTSYIEKAANHLRRERRLLDPYLLRHVSPLGWEHICGEVL